MAASPLEYVLRHLRQVVTPVGDELGDGELLERFVQRQDEAAFDQLVQRHGRMVLGVCRSFLSDSHDAEDAFQATFLVLVRSARSVKKQSSLSSWLYGVAYRTALKARAAAHRRRREEQVAAMRNHESSSLPADSDADRPVLAEELQRLPEKYRVPLLLCYLEGKTTEETARQLSWPQGTVKVRLMRGRDLLRDRLTRRGLTLSAAGLPLALNESLASAAVSPALAQSTLRVALLSAAQPTAVGSLPASVAMLTEGVLHAMFLAKIKNAAALLLGLACFVGAAGLITYQTLAKDGKVPVVQLPDDLQAVVLCWDVQRTDLPRKTEDLVLEVRADGSVTVRDPYGPGKQVSAQLSPTELQELLRFAIHDQRFFSIDSAKAHAAIDLARPTTLLRIYADGREHEIRCLDPRGQSQGSAEEQQLAAIEQRLERLVYWTYAGGKNGIDAAVALANEQLGQEFPEAPPLTAADLQTALQRTDGSAEITLERRGVAEDRNPFSFVFAQIERSVGLAPQVALRVNLFAAAADSEDKPPQRPLRVDPQPIAADKSVKYDYDIVYVRAPRLVQGRDGKERQAEVWPNAAEPEKLRASTDMMLLHPDGSEEVLVAGGQGAIADPYVSFDAQWVYYSYFHDLSGQGGADVYKVNVPTRKTVRLTHQQATPNTGVVSGKTAVARGVYNMHPCPLPGGRVAFISDRDGFKAPRGAQRSLQLFVMDDDGGNVEKIGYLNVGQALHPVVLKDGRIIFSSLEMQGKHNTGWGILGIHPDGTAWDPAVSGLSLGGAPIPFHFQTQLSDGSIVVENYYTPAMGGFGVYFKQPARAPAGTPPFGPGKVKHDPKMAMMSSNFRMPFQPYGMEVLTRFTHNHDSPALRCDPKDPKSRHVGWVTHPCGAPDNHLLTVWTGLMPANQGRIIDDGLPVDAGIYLIKGGRPLWEPGDMVLVKNDPKYNEQWPRPLVPYKRIYGVDEPERLPSLRNDGKLSKHLPEGTPFGLVGTSSLYKRESYPLGEVLPGSVTATGALYAAFPTREHRTNWDGQGADAGLYANSDIHAIRILAMEPPSLTSVGRFTNHAGERLRILGEIPVRKFSQPAGSQPLDPDGNPDTSFLAKIPTDVAWTFQTLDKDGMVLNMAQTWHQLRPGEIRHDCGGCHAHSQKPTDFNLTVAAKKDYAVFDLTKSTPLLTAKKSDQSGKQWDDKDETGLRYATEVLNVEYHRDVKPIFERSCVACHGASSGNAAGGLVLDDDKLKEGRPATYSMLLHAKDNKTEPRVWPSQSRNSLLTWKLFGRRVDGFPEKPVLGPEAGYTGYMNRGGVPWSGFKGSIMPPPEAVAGTYAGPNGQKIKVAPLTDEDRRTIIRWIDLGCPINLDHGSKNPDRQGNGWLLDDQRPTLNLTHPRPAGNPTLTRLLVGMHDYGTGLDLESFSVVADFPLDGVKPGENLANKFKAMPDSRWELTLSQPLTELPKGKLMVSVKDKQGNTTRIERTFSVVPQMK